MKQILAIIFFLTLTSVCFAQLADDFSDGDFTNNPTWSGSTSQFTVNTSKQLQLNNIIAGTSYLTTPFSTSTLDNFEWQVYVKQSFSPSGSNFGRVYLVSDQTDLTQPLNGYYLQFGEAGSLDAIVLYRQSGTSMTPVLRGTNAAIAASFGVRVKVTRDNTGLWSLYTDYTGGTNFSFEKSGTDATINTSSYFGVLCTYTITNAAKFFYDNISITALPPPPDTSPPTLVSVDTISSNAVSVLFSEMLDVPSVENISNYSVSNSVGNPLSAVLQADKKTVVLSFAKDFPNGFQNQLSVSNIKDAVGNIMTAATMSFFYFKSFPSKNKDIIFTEVFSDPSPQVGLPAQEYVEIYNRSSNPIDLSNWKLSDGSSTTVFGNKIIFPKEYWIVCSSSNVNLFSNYRNVMGVSNFPTLNNDGDNLTLRNQNNRTIDSISYSLDWYHDVDKQEGGWSMEIIDVTNLCSEGENWTASEDVSGGTPGKQNSVFAGKPDLTGPHLISVTPVSPFILNLTFNEKLEKDISAASFDLSPLISVSKKYFKDQSLREITIELSDALVVRELYTITVSNLTDCPGNFIQQDFSRLSFALPETADSLDILVNEILFNPRSGGVDFIEIYNNSPKYINLKNWKVGNFENGSLINSKVITATDFILPPLSYLVFTPDPVILSQHYSQSVYKTLFKTSLPSLPDDSGSITLVSDQGLMIDHFLYSEKMHSPFIKDAEGVSLERISFSESTNEAGNWKSANAIAGFATPGFANSNSRTESFINENAVNVDPEIFSPSAPGQDFSKINFKFDQSGMAANVKILDSQGRLIKTLASNETLSHEGFFRWDGDRDDGTRSRVGYYIVWFEVFDANGSSTVFRKRAVIGK